jgi:outer membrane protein assembly factor BamB
MCFLSRLLALTLIVALLSEASHAVARTSAGDLVWQDHFDLASGQDVARAVAAGKRRVVAVGSAQNGAGNDDFLVRVYDAKTGTLLWNDLVDIAGGEDAATAVVMQDDRIIVAGTGTDATGGHLLILRSYIAKTGTLAWEDRVSVATVNGLALGGSHVVVAGTITDAAGNPRLAVRAYIAKSGVLDWHDEPAPPAGFVHFGGASRGVTIQGERVFVVGTVRTPAELGDSNPTCLVRAYVTRNGKLDWESLHLPTRCSATAIATDGKRVIIAALGAVNLDDFLVQSYDAETGQFLWEDRTSVGTGFDNAAVAVDIERRRAFVAGWVRWVPGTSNQEAFLVRAYNTESGILRWEDQYPSPQICICNAHDVVVDSGGVFAVGHAAPPGTWVVRAYDAKQGGLLWSDNFAPVGGTGPNPFAPQGALAVAADEGRIFVAGSGINATGNADFILRAYDAK